LSAFRTTQLRGPKGLWEGAEIKDYAFEVSDSIKGPWRELVDGTMEQGQQVQTFCHEITKSRYWRLFMKNEYGYGFITLATIEFRGKLLGDRSMNMNTGAMDWSRWNRQKDAMPATSSASTPAILAEEEQYVDLLFDLPPRHKIYYEDKRREVQEDSDGASLTLLMRDGQPRQSEIPDSRMVNRLEISGLNSKANRAEDLVLGYGRGVVPIGTSTSLYFEGWFQTAELGRFFGTHGKFSALFEQVRIIED
jgi:hypothetical protein